MKADEAGTPEEAGRSEEPDGTSMPVESQAEEEGGPEELVDAEELVVLEEDLGAPRPPSGSSRPRRGRGKRRVAPDQARRRGLTGEQRLLILDAWLRSTLAAKDFAPLVGVSKHTLHDWKQKFDKEGPAGLEDRPRRRTGSRLSEATKRAILLMKQAHPDWGEERLHHMLERSEGLYASPGAIGRVLEEAGYEVVGEPTRPHPDKPRRFERAKPNELWQTDLFTFVLKRQNRRVHLVAYMDDYSRFVVGYGLHASASGALVREALEAAIANYGAPKEVLTDNGPQYVTWRGKSAFRKLCERRGIKQIVARPRRPRTLGKVERFWGSLWRECVESAVFLDLDDARRRIGLFMDHYNFHRTHQGLGGHVPADRFFRSAPEVKQTLAARVANNGLELARDGLPRKDFYLTGRVGDVGISLHAEGEQVVLTREDGTREEVNLSATGRRGDEDPPPDLPEPLATAAALPVAPGEEDAPEPEPGTSPLDESLRRLDELRAHERTESRGSAPAPVREDGTSGDGGPEGAVADDADPTDAGPLEADLVEADDGDGSDDDDGFVAGEEGTS